MGRWSGPRAALGPDVSFPAVDGVLGQAGLGLCLSSRFLIVLSGSYIRA